MKIPKRIASVVINSLKGGVVPRIGLPYITVGRQAEIDALLHDIAIIEDGGASFRFVVGKYGSGKSFLLQTIRNYAMEKNFVVADADLSPERRLQGTRGQGLATYKELIRNLATRTRPEGGALTLILDRWISAVQSETAAASGLSPEEPSFAQLVERRIYEVVNALNEMVHGFDFARLLTAYYRSYVDGDDEQKARVIRWFRGEYATKSEAKAELSVNMVISDEDWYDYVKLFAVFLVCPCRIQNRYGTVFTNFTAQVFHALHKAFLCCDRAVTHLLQNDVIPFFILQQLQCFCAEPCFRVQLLT